jgi:hypothetical protein
MNVALGNSISPDTCSTNGTGAPYTIVFSQTGTITLASTTLPKVTGGITLTITGPTTSPAGMTIDGAGSVQLMRVAQGATLNLQNLTLAHGNAVDSLDPPPLIGGPNVTDGEGGAIFNEGTLTISNCTFSANQATIESLGVFDRNVGSGGGAIFNSKGTLNITNSTFSANKAAPVSEGALGGAGGAIFEDDGTLTATNSTFSANQAIGGPVQENGGTGGPGQGGAIFGNGREGTITITNSTFSANQAIGGPAQPTETGGLGEGGALFQGGIMITVSKSAFLNNQATGGAATGTPAAGGNGLGGAFWLDAHPGGALTSDINNSTFSGNQATGGIATDSAFNGQSDGGAIFAEVILALTNTTISGNTSGTAKSGSIASVAGEVLIEGSIVAGNTPDNCSSAQIIIPGQLPIPPADMGYNISDDDTCLFKKTGTANNGDGVNPILAAIGNYGGPTMTFALNPGSPAIDAIPVAQCKDLITGNPLMTDQRGFPRPDSGEVCCDIGAYEFQETFAGQPGTSNCEGNSASALATQYGGIDHAASALCYPSVKALQDAIRAFCG